MPRLPVSTALAALLAAAAPAVAHPKLMSADPTPNAVVAPPDRIVLRFSEKLMPAFSKAELAGRARVASVAAIAPDGKALVVTPGKKLTPGRYIVAWTVVAADTHRIKGSYAFTVK